MVQLKANLKGLPQNAKNLFQFLMVQLKASKIK